MSVIKGNGMINIVACRRGGMHEDGQTADFVGGGDMLTGVPTRVSLWTHIHVSGGEDSDKQGTGKKCGEIGNGQRALSGIIMYQHKCTSNRIFACYVDSSNPRLGSKP